jgi:hypothetical protein
MTAKIVVADFLREHQIMIGEKNFGFIHLYPLQQASA